MRYMRLLLLLSAVAILASSMVMAGSRAPSRMAVCGIISAIDTTANTITVTPPAPPAGSRRTPPPPVTFGVTSDSKISLDRNTVDITGHAVGEWCEAALIKAADGSWGAVRLCATTPFVIGALSAIDATANTITVQPPSPRCARTPAPAVPFQVADTTTIAKNGSAVLADLLADDVVKVSFLEPADATTVPTAIKIEVLPDEFCGKVTAVDATLGTITLQAGKTTQTLNVDPNAKIVVARKTATLADVVVGSGVELDYFQTSAGLLAVNIWATPPRTSSQSKARR